MAKIAFLFPGQGAQTVGMAKETAAAVPAAKELFDRAADLLGYDLLKVCAEGPEDRLNSTVVSQPALFVAGLAGVEKLRLEKPEVVDQCEAAAGLSLGEYTALVFAGALTFEEGLRVVQARGESMQAAADAVPSGMCSVLGLDEAKLKELCAAASTEGLIAPANYLCPGNTAVSGVKAACEKLERIAEEFGAMKTIRLAVAGAFHTEIMKPACEKLAAALAAATLKPSRIPVISNVDAVAHPDADDLRSILVRQVVTPVQWERSMRSLLDQGFDAFYEIGPGRVLAALMKRIHRQA
ncbi:MAG: ACP S-malonyltransferase, partial [Planctomycetia bacterium]